MAPETVEELPGSAGWKRALDAFCLELRTRGASPNTLRAYASVLDRVGVGFDT